MKIALVIQNADRRLGGAESYTLDLARRMGRSSEGRGHQVTVIAERGPGAVAEGAAASGYHVAYLGSKGASRWARLRNFLARVRDLYDGATYDIVHAMLPVWKCDVYQPHSGLAADMLATGHLKHRGRMVQKFSRMANQLNAKRRGLAQIERALMRETAAHGGPWLLSFSTSMRDFATEQFRLPADRMVMLMNGIDLARFDPAAGARAREAIRGEWRIGDRKRLGLFVGNNWKLKGVRDALEALAGIDPRLVLMIAGRDDPGPYKKIARRLGIADRVIFTGSIGDTRPLYGAADFLVLPTRRDTCSLVVLEALAMGLPVITTRQNGASEAMEDARQGFLIERGDVAALTDAMNALLDDGLRHRMAQHALAIRDTLSLQQHVSRIEAVYRRVMQQKSLTPST